MPANTELRLMQQPTKPPQEQTTTNAGNGEHANDLEKSNENRIKFDLDSNENSQAFTDQNDNSIGAKSSDEVVRNASINSRKASNHHENNPGQAKQQRELDVPKKETIARFKRAATEKSIDVEQKKKKIQLAAITEAQVQSNNQGNGKSNQLSSSSSQSTSKAAPVMTNLPQPQQLVTTTTSTSTPKHVATVRVIAVNAAPQPKQQQQAPVPRQPQQIGTEKPQIFGLTNGTLFGNYHLANPILLYGLPVLVCLFFMLLLYFIMKSCRKLRDSSKHKAHHSSSKGSGCSFKPAQDNGPVEFLSGGKVVNSLRGIQIIGNKDSDGRHLTLNMEATSYDGSASNVDNLSASSRSSRGNKKSKERRERNDIDEKSLGKLKFKIEYDFSRSVLIVTVLEAQNLPGLDIGGSSDPYVKIGLIPTDGKKRCERTRIKKRNLNPIFNETFEFKFSYAIVVTKTLVLAVYDYDRFSRHDEIGQVSIPISTIDLAQEPCLEEWRELTRITDTQASGGPGSNGWQLGDLRLSLRYVPTAGKLTVIIMEARKLKKMDVGGLSDPYVKLALMNHGQRVKKKKTSIKKCTLNPQYNESFSFEIPFEQVQKVQLIITVVDYDRIGTSEPIGKIVLGCEGTTGSSELRHWRDMLASPRRSIEQWHSLKDIGVSASCEMSSTGQANNFQVEN